MTTPKQRAEWRRECSQVVGHERVGTWCDVATMLLDDVESLEADAAAMRIWVDGIADESCSWLPSEEREEWRHIRSGSTAGRALLDELAKLRAVAEAVEAEKVRHTRRLLDALAAWRANPG